jgi:branched-chain amino acid transport system permease protein
VRNLRAALARQYDRIPDNRRGLALIATVIAAYALSLVIPGLGSFVDDKMPYEVVVIGLITGTVTALLAIGLILLYRSNRFINFAYGAMGSMVGVLSVALYKEHGLSYWAMLPLAVTGGLINGALIEMLVIRRFANSSRLILTVASIGLAQLLGGLEFLGAKKLGFLSLTGGISVPIRSISIDLGDKTLGGDEVLIMLVVPFVILGLTYFLLRTDAGVAIRAAAENSDRALLLGIPVRRLSTIVWALAGGLSALTYVLKVPFSGVVPGVANGPTVLLPGLAAAVVARMESLPIAFAAGLGLGIVEQTVRWNSTGSPSFVNVAYFAVILLALLLQRGRLSRALDNVTSSWNSASVVKPVPVELRHLPEVRYPKAGLIALVAVAFIAIPGGWSSSQQLLSAFAIVWAMVAVSLVVLTGWGGHISLGQFGLVGVGAIVTANVIEKWHGDFFVALLLSALAGAVGALLVGLPALRIKGLFLAVTTLAFAIMLDSYFFNTDRFSSILPTTVKRPLLWQRFELAHNYDMYLTCLGFLGLSMLAAMGVRKARSGRVVIATRDNQRAADAAAVNTTAVKLSAFLLAGAIAGVAGGLHVLIQQGLAQNTYSPVDSITVFSTAVIGGLGSLGGAISGVLLFRWLETITALGDLRLLLTGTGLLVVLYALPGGFGQLFISLRDRYLRRVANRRGILVPSLVADKRGVENSVGLLQTALTDEVDDEIGLEIIVPEEELIAVAAHE